MLNIGNKKLKDANIGTTPLDSIYLGSTLIRRKEYVQWYDPEFKRVILEKYNNGKEMKFNSNIILGKSDFMSASILSLSNLSGILDLNNVIRINSYSEFMELGSNGTGLQVIYPYNTNIPIFQGDSGISNNNNYTIICRAINPPLLTIGSNIYKDNIVGYSFALYKCYPFNCDVKHIYVPDESVDLYKNDTKYGIQLENSDEITEHTGTVECFDYDFTGIKERNISWSRFKDIIKPLSEYIES